MKTKIKIQIPWWSKIIIKILLSRIPFGYVFWQKLGLFRHGSMDLSDYAISVFEKHLKKTNLSGKLSGKTILELGPGDSIATAIIAFTYGGHAILVDAGSFSRTDIKPYLNLIKALKNKGLTPPDISSCQNINEILSHCHARYMTFGLKSLKMIDDNSVEIIFSEAVLEHIYKQEFLDTMKECYRILKPDGICSHTVDLRDHLGGALNNLRFSERLWESEVFSKSGFYTNRIRYSQMKFLFKQAGFQEEDSCISKWETLPTQKNHMSKEFRSIPNNELLVSKFEILLRKIQKSKTK